MRDTVESCVTWDRYIDFQETVKRATLRAIQEVTGRSGSCTVRFTHLYPDGPAPYFTWHALGEKAKLVDQFWAIKAAASEAMVNARGTITHHHALCRDHRIWYDRERPELLRQKGQIYSPSSISPLISSERPIPPSVIVASAGSLSLPLSLPSVKPCRTAFSISRWAVTPSLLRNLRMLVLKTSSFIITSVLRLSVGLGSKLRTRRRTIDAPIQDPRANGDRGCKDEAAAFW